MVGQKSTEGSLRSRETSPLVSNFSAPVIADASAKEIGVVLELVIGGWLGAHTSKTHYNH
jgi:hypothetical protein